MGRIGYSPSEERFKVSKRAEDPISHERIRGLNRMFKQLRSDVPEVHVAFSVFGSLVKGKKLTPEIALDTDVDFVIFFDEDDVRHNHGTLMKKHPQYAARYRAILSSPHFQMFVKHPEEYEHGVATLAMEAFLGLWMDDHARTFMKAPKHLFFQQIGEEGLNSLFHRVELLAGKKVANAHSGIEEYIAQDNGYAQEIARFFHLDVGGGLKQYRQHFLAKLASLSPIGREHFWSVVDRCVRNVERGNIIPASAERQFPKTYDEAVKYYGLPKSTAA